MTKKLQTLTLTLIFISCFNLIKGQTVTYDLRCSSDNSTYELYVTRNTTAAAPLTTMASSRITVVLPTGTRTMAFSNEGGMTYTALPVISNPDNDGNDYYGFSTTGGVSLIGVLTADTPQLWMTFTPSDGTSKDARLFENGTDPEATDPGMGGVDLSNSFFTITISGINSEYNGNTSSTINCGGTLSVEDVNLSALALYPNPSRNRVYIKGNKSSLKTLEIHNMNGQLLERKSIDNGDNLESIDISRLESAVYFINLYSENGQKTLRLVKE